jgi:fructose-1,6-bisphosphatase II
LKAQTDFKAILLTMKSMERALVLETVHLTEQAALAASHTIGKGDKIAVDQAGTEAMRRVLNELPISGRVVIGEGEMDEAPMLYIGEKLGAGGLEVDIAVDPVEGTNACARGLANSIAVIALSEKGGLLGAPDMYMEKLVVGPPAAGKVSLEWSVATNLRAVAKSLERPVEDVVVVGA